MVQNLADVGLTGKEINRCMFSFDENVYTDTYIFLRGIRCNKRSPL